MPSMSAPKLSKIGWEIVGYDSILERPILSVYHGNIKHWIEEQSTHMWKYYDLSESMQSPVPIGWSFVLLEELEVWFKLRWS